MYTQSERGLLQKAEANNYNLNEITAQNSTTIIIKTHYSHQSGDNHKV
jgi:hypothetical protein